MLWKALRNPPPYIQLHILKQESHRHQYGNSKVDIQAVHQRTTHLPALQMTDLDRTHTHLEHLPPKTEPQRPRTGYRRTPLTPHTNLAELTQNRPKERM